MKAYYLRGGHTFMAVGPLRLIRGSEPKVSKRGSHSPRRALLSLVALGSLLGGCNKGGTAGKSTEQTSASLGSTAAALSVAPMASVAERPVVPATPEAPAPAQELAITWSDPPEWERVTPKSRMRLAQYKVKPVSGDTEPGEVTLFHFGPNMGGGVEENITRWTNQFSGVDAKAIKRTTKTNGPLSHHLVQIESGLFQTSPMMGGPAQPKANYGLLGAVTEAPSGKYFFKLTGPSKTVAANLGAFEKLIESIKTK
jgi:hypothetical protein